MKCKCGEPLVKATEKGYSWFCIACRINYYTNEVSNNKGSLSILEKILYDGKRPLYKKGNKQKIYKYKHNSNKK
jgi:hypothetical protein